MVLPGPEMLYFVGLHTQKMENEHQSPHMEIESRLDTLNKKMDWKITSSTGASRIEAVCSIFPVTKKIVCLSPLPFLWA